MKIILTDRQTDRRFDFDLLRLILVILVLIGHSAYYTIDTMFGGIYFFELMKYAGVRDTVFHKMAIILSNFIYTFHMPAFFALSGAVFYIQYQRHKYTSLQILIKEKNERIIYPLVFVWLCWNVPIKVVSGYYSQVENPVVKSILQILFPKSVYLWFLEALFIIFILMFFILEYVQDVKKQMIIIIICFCIGLYIQYACGYMILFGNPFKHIFWFYFGIYIERKNIKKNLVYNPIKYVGIFSFLFLGFYFIYLMDIYEKWLVKEIVLPLIGTIWLWSVVVWIEKKLQMREKILLSKMATYTYGIYLYAEPLNYLILYLSYIVWGISVFGEEKASIMIYFTRMVGTAGIAIIITKILKKKNFRIKAY